MTGLEGGSMEIWLPVLRTVILLAAFFLIWTKVRPAQEALRRGIGFVLGGLAALGLGNLTDFADRFFSDSGFPFEILIFAGYGIGAILLIVGMIRWMTEFRHLEVSHNLLSERAEELDLSNQELEATVEQLHRVEEALRASQSEYKKIIHEMIDIFYRTDMEGRIIIISNSVKELTGWSVEEMLGTKMADYYQEPTQREDFLKKLQEGNGVVRAYEAAMRARDGSEIWVQTNAHFYHNEKGEIAGVEGTVRNVTELVQARRKLEALANYDSLTGAANRNLFYEHLRHAMARARRTHEPVALLYVDLDEFKQINDSYGHECGDMVLLVVATRIREALRESDLIARIGGDEFVVILESQAEPEKAVRVAEKILSNIATPVPWKEMEVTPGASIGVVFYDGGEMEPDTLVNKADGAMYAAKHEGKGRVKMMELNG